MDLLFVLTWTYCAPNLFSKAIFFRVGNTKIVFVFLTQTRRLVSCVLQLMNSWNLNSVDNAGLSTPPRPSEICEQKLEHIGEAIFDIPFMVQSHAESIKKILGAL